LVFLFSFLVLLVFDLGDAVRRDADPERRLRGARDGSASPRSGIPSAPDPPAPRRAPASLTVVFSGLRTIEVYQYLYKRPEIDNSKARAQPGPWPRGHDSAGRAR
jgi:hypothetical protein